MRKADLHLWRSTKSEEDGWSSEQLERTGNEGKDQKSSRHLSSVQVSELHHKDDYLSQPQKLLWGIMRVGED